MSTIGERLRMIRGGRSRKEFAAQYGVHPNTIMRYEEGLRKHIPQDFIDLLAGNENINPIWLMSGEGERFCFVIGGSEKPELGEQIELVTALREQIETQRRHIAALEQNTELAKLAMDALRRENEALRGQLEATQRQVTMLEDLLAAERQKTPQNAVDRIQAAG